MATFRKGLKFSKWEDVFRAVEEYSEVTLQPFVRSSTKLCSTSNLNLKEGQPMYPEQMKYVYWTFKCCHGGKYTARPNGVRKRTSQKVGCNAKIHAALDKSRTEIVIVTLDEDHCHELDTSVSEIRKKRKYHHESSAQNSKSSKAPKLSRKVLLPPETSSQPIAVQSSSPVLKMMQVIPNPTLVSKSADVSNSKPVLRPLLPETTKSPVVVALKSKIEPSSSVSQSESQPHPTPLSKQTAAGFEKMNSSCPSAAAEKPDCVFHSCCGSSLLSFVQRKDEEDRKLREKEMDLRRAEMILRQKEIEILRERFEFDKLERRALLDMLKGQLQTLQKNYCDVKREEVNGSYTIVFDNNVLDKK